MGEIWGIDESYVAENVPSGERGASASVVPVGLVPPLRPTTSDFIRRCFPC